MAGEFTFSVKLAIADRICEVRHERFGPAGASELAASLGLPLRTWLNYEDGVTIPGDVLLRFLAIAGVDAHWLLTGEGRRYRAGDPVGSDRQSAYLFPRNAPVMII